MTKKKICLVGSFSVGKTSLTRRFVSNEFSDDYLTTMGVKIERRNVEFDGHEVALMIWDLAGRDEFARVQQSYLIGAAGFLFVADGTRKETVSEMLEEIAEVRGQIGEVPSLILLNKCDLEDEWEVDDATVDSLGESFRVLRTSALSGENVEEAFVELTRDMIAAGAT